MTPEMISRARENARKVNATNVDFRSGEAVRRQAATVGSNSDRTPSSWSETLRPHARMVPCAS